jgi:hypothetical protein
VGANGIGGSLRIVSLRSKPRNKEAHHNPGHTHDPQLAFLSGLEIATVLSIPQGVAEKEGESHRNAGKD